MSTFDSTLEKLRKENLDQFYTLVRMHLSFVVDINTDDVDSSTDKPKQFRWNFNKKNKNGLANSTQNNSKVTTESCSIIEDEILNVYEIMDFLSKEENVSQEGIFRRTGSLSRQQELRQLLMTSSKLELDNGKYSVHDCASVLKGFLAELPQPLLMDQYYQVYCNLAVQYPPQADTSETKLLTALQLLLLLLTPLHRRFLQRLLYLLRIAADNEPSNRMSPDTLATMFTPHLLCPRKLAPEILHTDAVALAPIISFMIKHSTELFETPQQLATDIAAYFTIRERKRMMSPDIDLDESITDRTAANTVYTFVDRYRTSIENESNPTDTALAQLYAHIQALPDSQHKRRLIKQFNRQNGYGTPIQVLRTGKVAGSRSFGDSIKKHIFAKGLLNKTPKKGSSGTTKAIEERNSTPLAKEKVKLPHEEINRHEVCHKNVVLKNLVNKIASTSSLDEDSDASNDSTSSEGVLNKTHKLSPKFVSEPNLSVNNDETPKNMKKRLFRSKFYSSSQNLNKKYHKKAFPLKATPTCVSCFDNTGSESESSLSNEKQSPSDNFEENQLKIAMKMQYLTSTPGVNDLVSEDQSCTTPHATNFRRASMSPITKSTQKLSKAMQESIMTPRSRKPLVITSEQRDSLPENEKGSEGSKSSAIYHSLSPKNDSDFVSSDESITTPIEAANTGNSDFASEIIDNGLPVPEIFISRMEKKGLTEPFREYLLSRSVLTATPVDLSLINNSDEKITDSLMFCLDGNIPTDLTLSINNLAVNRSIENSGKEIRSPLKNLNCLKMSPNRKRGASSLGHSALEVDDKIETKKINVDKENLLNYELRETDL